MQTRWHVIKSSLRQTDWVLALKEGVGYPRLNALAPNSEDVIQEEVEKPCPFCGCPTTWHYHEHYYTCSICQAEWTSCILLKSNCPHLKGRSAIITDAPPTWPAKLLKELAYIVEDGNKQRCSICGASAVADGW